MPKQWTIEIPKPSEARLIAAFQADLWRETYSRPGQTSRNIIVARDADEYLAEHRVNRRRQLIERARGSDMEYTRIARSRKGDTVIKALLYGAKEGDAQELWTLYVHSEFHGKGLAQEITEGFIEWCDDDQPIDVGVDRENHRAQRFYSKMGFKDTGRKRPFNSYITEKIMRRGKGRMI